MKPRSPSHWPYVWLAILFAVVMVSEVSFTLDVLRSLRFEYPYPPIGVGDPWPTIRDVNPLARGSGLRAGESMACWRAAVSLVVPSPVAPKSRTFRISFGLD